MRLPLSREHIYTPNNALKVLCLIKELCKPGDEPVFTVRDEKEGYISLRTLFVDFTVEDPSEATFASFVFNDTGYWLKARENRKLKPFLDEWREEATIKRKAIAFKAVVKEVQSGGKSAFSAAKFLIEEPYKDKRAPKVKEEVKKTTEKAKSSVFIPDLEEFMSNGKTN